MIVLLLLLLLLLLLGLGLCVAAAHVAGQRHAKVPGHVLLVLLALLLALVGQQRRRGDPLLANSGPMGGSTMGIPYSIDMCVRAAAANWDWGLFGLNACVCAYVRTRADWLLGCWAVCYGGVRSCGALASALLWLWLTGLEANSRIAELLT